MGKVAIFLLILAMVFVFPVLIALRMVKSLKEQGDKKGVRVLIVLCGLGLVYFVYSAFYPTDGICRDKYERYTALRFPSSGKILEKEASIINDIKGSFTDCYLIRMNGKDYSSALHEVISQKKFHEHDTFLVFSKQYRKVAGKIKGRKFHKVFSDGTKAYIFLGFLDDGHSVLINIVGRQSALTNLPPVKNHNVICDE